MTRIASTTPSYRLTTSTQPVFVPTAAPSPSGLTDTFQAAVRLREIGRGSTGEDVKAWQTALVELGYLTRAQMASGPGTFGPLTEAATKRFQAEHKLVVSGRVGVATRAAMTKARTQLREFKTETLARGMNNEAVRLLKRDLVAVGVMKQETYSAHPFQFGSGTEAAVKQFQREHGLVVSGKVGSATRKKLAEVIARGHSALPTVRNISQFISAMPGSFCGPTTVTMIAKAFGKLGNFGDAAAINWLAAQGGVGSAGTGWPGIQVMARAAGLQPSTPMYGADLSWVNAQLAAGKLVAANGNRSVTLDHASRNDGVTGGHWIVIAGRASNGDYLVEDPSTDCKRLSPSEMARYFNAREGGGVGIAIGK